MITLAAKAAKAGRRGGSRKVRSRNNTRKLTSIGRRSSRGGKRVVYNRKARSEWYRRNREKMQAYGRKYYRRNKEKIKKSVRAWRRKIKRLGVSALYKGRHAGGRRPATLPRSARSTRSSRVGATKKKQAKRGAKLARAARRR